MHILIRMIVIGGLLVGLGLSSQAEDARPKGPTVTTEQLGGKERFALYVSTDKPIYRATESVYIRGVLLNAHDNTPYGNQFNVVVKITGPKGEVVFNGFANGEDSSSGMQWTIPEGTAGGQYTVLVSSPQLGVAESKRTFDVRAYRAPRLKSQIEFTRDGYGPGDRVQASVKISRAEGGIPKGAKITAIARVDGEEVFNKSGLSVDQRGLCFTEFTLPQQIAIGDGTMSFVIEDGGVVETANKTLPILLQDLDIHFYPEGGDLIGGLPSRVYVQANRPDGKPADIEGYIAEMRGDKILKKLDATLKTRHEGRGYIRFTPNANKRYALLLSSPSGISKPFPLPEVQQQGIVLSAVKSVFDFSDTIELALQGTGSEGNLTVTLHKREQQLDKLTLAATSEKQRVRLNPADAEGVLVVTVWSGLQPLAERLIYRRPKFAVNIDIKPSKERYVPGEPVVLDILATDTNGNPVEAVVGLTVTDDAVLEMIEDRDKAPQLPVMVYLEHEVADLADAQIYLDAQNPEAPEALDLLMGTQGWRRFALVRYDELLAAKGTATQRLFASKDLSAQWQAVARKKRLEGRVLPQAAAINAVEVRAMAEVAEDQAPAVQQPQREALAAAPLAKPDIADQRQNRFAEEKAALFDRAILEEQALEMDMQAVYVREYAHKARANRKPNDRVDFTETLYWNRGVRTSARDGKAQIRFDLSDSVTSFRVSADAFGRNGGLGAAQSLIESVEPFYIEPKMPLSATAGDLIELPVALVNATDDALEQVNLLVRAEGLTFPTVAPLGLKARERGRQQIRFNASKPGRYSITFQAAGGTFTDSVTRELEVQPKGFPVAINQGGLLSADQPLNTKLVIPQEVEPGSLRAVVKIHPSPLASMEEALNALLREPYGCFEQTSSTTYPLVMAQQYFTSHQGIAPEKIAKAKTLLEKGYKRLISFEAKDNGYEWFGANPAHEALTAYGLMEFVDMAQVMEVDSGMIERTRQWLLERRDGKGGFKRNDKALDSFGRAPVPTTNAYIVWSLLESGEPKANLQKEIAAVKQQALDSQDTYIIALAANILYLIDDRADAARLATRLREAMHTDGSVAGGETSITRSGGDALTIETTSLSILAWLKDDERWAAQVERSMQWLFERSKAGRFGSTQSTVLALKAINAYDTKRAKPSQDGSVQLWLDGKRFGNPLHFTTESKGAIELPDFAAALTPGEHHLALRMTDGSKMPFAMEVSYNTSLPPSDERSAVRISTELVDQSVLEGEVTEINIEIQVGDEDAPTPIAIIGIPAGLEVRHDQLKEWVSAGRISAYEVLDREVVLYWRALKAEQRVTLPLTLTAAIPGNYTAPASRSYLYYTDEHKAWVPGTKVTIRGR